MSDRLTPEWTINSEGAFGDNGRIGDIGELEVFHFLQEDPLLTVEHHPTNQEKQISGVDITVNGYGLDVKTNLHSERDVVIEKAKLMRSKAKWWLHWNNRDDYIMYRVKYMQRLVKDMSPRGKGGLVFIKREVAETL